MNRRTVILSDTHLAGNGSGAGCADALRPLWQGADELIINGDVAELSHPDLRVDAAREVMQIQDLCEADGVRLTMLAGNHDPHLTDRRFLRLCSGEVFLTHGDMLHPAISPWTTHARKLRELHQDALRQLTLIDRSQIEMRAQAAAHASNQKWEHIAAEELPQLGPIARQADRINKIAKVLWFWQRLPGLAARFAQRYAPDARFFVFGHIHRAGVWRFGHQTIINTGAYHCPRNPHAVVVDGQTLTMHKVHYDAKQGHRLADKPRFSAQLNNAQQLPPDVAVQAERVDDQTAA